MKKTLIPIVITTLLMAIFYSLMAWFMNDSSFTSWPPIARLFVCLVGGCYAAGSGFVTFLCIKS